MVFATKALDNNKQQHFGHLLLEHLAIDRQKAPYNMQVGKNAGRRNMFVNFWFFVGAFVPADGMQSAKIYNLYFN